MNFLSTHFAFKEVWIRKKGLQFEGLPIKVPETLEELNEECFAQFGTLSTLMPL